MATSLVDRAGRTEFAQKLCTALGIPMEQTRRIVLDIGTDCAVTAYIEMYAGQSIIDLDWEKGMVIKTKTILD